MDVLVKENEVKVPEKPILRYHQREELKAEVEEIDNALSPENPFRHKSRTDVTEVFNRGKRLKKQLQDFSPPEVSGSVKDKLVKEARAIEERILPGMPTHEEMRKNPAGMVGRHMRWEKANKKAILRWKNLQQMIEPDSNDPDLSNFERLRPSGEMDMFRANAQINGYMSYGRVPQENWDQVFPSKPNSALEQVKKVEAERKGRQWTEEQKEAARERMAKARAAIGKPKENDSPSQVEEGESVKHEGA